MYVRNIPDVSLQLGLTIFVGPLLLGYNARDSGLPNKYSSSRGLPRHKDEDQVELDVNRSFIYYPKSKNILFSVD